jgi:hypothetical protein
MKKHLYPLIVALAVAGVTFGCSESGKVDSGGVSLVISDFDGLPIRVPVNGAGGGIQVDQVILRSILQVPSEGSTNLQTIELKSYEVVFTRADRGTRVPPPLVQLYLGTVPPNGTTTIDNFPIMLADQMLTQPISDLFFSNGGFDKETGEQVIRLNVSLRFFGRTLSGRDVVTNPQRFTLELVP